MSDITAFANRLGKNAKHYLKWARRHNIEAWRLYDRDIPQFPFAIDVYGGQIHLQEYDTGWLMQPKNMKPGSRKCSKRWLLSQALRRPTSI